MFALSLAKQVREMINSSEMMEEGLIPVVCAFFNTSRAAATPCHLLAGLAKRAEEEAAQPCLQEAKRSSSRKGWNLYAFTEKGTIFFFNE